MGTSKSNTGPGNNTPLLPPWATDPILPEDEKEKDQKEAEQSNSEKLDPNYGSFSSARRNITKYINNRSSKNFRNAASSYVKSYGGGRRASRTAISGKASGGRLSGFLSGIANQGIERTLERFGLSDCLGKSAEYTLTKIADLVSPSGATNEDAAAREAIIDAMSFVYDNFELNDKDITELDSISKSDFELVIKEYVSSYIFNRWLHELGLKFEEKAASTSELIEIEKEAKEYIREAVKLDLGKIDLLKVDFNSGNGKRIMNKIFDVAYILIESL